MNHRPPITQDNFNPKYHVAEYKRVCNECGKVWHSLVEREKIIQDKMTSNFCLMCGTCNSNDSAFAQHNRNLDANANTLTDLRKCPECGSGNYTETTIYYEKQDQ